MRIVNPDSDEGVRVAINALLSKKDIGVEVLVTDDWCVVKYNTFTHSTWDELSTHLTAGDAYQAALLHWKSLS